MTTFESSARSEVLHVLPNGKKVFRVRRADGNYEHVLEGDEKAKAKSRDKKLKTRRGTQNRLRDAAHYLTDSNDRRTACGQVLAPAFEDGRKLNHPCDSKFYISKRTGLWYATGLVKCNSTWTCAVCAFEIHAERADHLRVLIGDWWGEDRCLMSSNTVRHNASMKLKPLREGVVNAHRRMSQGEGQGSFAERNAAIRAKLGEVHNVRGLEVTHGAQGWHPHLHKIHLCENSWRSAKGQLVDHPLDWSTVHALSDICEEMNSLWRDAIAQQFDGDAAYEPNKHGVDLRTCSVASYVAKMGFADDAIDDAGSPEDDAPSAHSGVHLEMTSPVLKAAKGKNRTPWQILDAFDQKKRAEVDSAREAHLWRDWCAGIKSARQLEFSRARKGAVGVQAAFEEWLRVAVYWTANREADPAAYESWLCAESIRRGFEVEHLRDEYADPRRVARIERVLRALTRKKRKTSDEHEHSDEGGGIVSTDAGAANAAVDAPDAPADPADELMGVLPHYVWALIARLCSIPVLIMAGERGGWPAVVAEVAARAERAKAQLYDAYPRDARVYLPVDERDVEAASVWIAAELARVQVAAAA